MLSIQRIRDVDYYENLTALDDYYGAAVEPPGRWLGSAAETFGLSGQVASDDLAKIFSGFSPSGDALVQNAGKSLSDDKKGHRPGWDLTYSASKSVSVLWALVDEATRQVIEECHDAAVTLTMGIAEAECGWSRQGKGGSVIDKATLLIAAYQHGTSRALDPNLHTHCLVANIGLSEDGKTRTLVSQSFYRWKMTLGQVYQNELAHQLQTKLGLGIIATPNGCEIAGVSQELTRHFSKRRKEIEEQLKAKGRFSAKASEIAALDTRKKKVDQPRSELFETWQAVSRELGYEPTHALRLEARPQQTPLSVRAIEAKAKQAIERLTESQAYFTKREVLRSIANSSIGQGVSSAELLATLSRFLNRSPDVIHLEERNLERHYTTTKVLEQETSLLVAAEKMARDATFAVDPSVVTNTLQNHEGVANRSEQRTAVEELLSSGRLKLLTGGPGTGKTFVLDAAREAWEKAGYEVLGTSLAGKAVQELASKANIQSDTVAKLLRDLDATPLATVQHHANEMVKAAIGKRTRPPQRLSLDSNTIIVIDEAGMLDTPQLMRLLNHAEKRGAKVVLVGDPKQLPPIGAGSPFQALLGRHPHAMLVTNERQRDEVDKLAIAAMAKGRAEEVVKRYEERGRLVIGSDRRDIVRKLTDEWAREGGLRKPDEHRIFVSTNADRIAINDRCQETRLEAGLLEPEVFLTVRRQESIEGRKPTVIREDFHVGDPVMCLQRSRSLGVENGTSGIVTAVHRDEKKLTIAVPDGKRLRDVEIPLRRYPHLTRGYAQTTHKGQGQTVEHAYILLGGPMQNREMTYVQISRARGTTRLYADSLDAGPNREGLYRMLERSAEKLLAHDLLERSRLRVDSGQTPLAAIDYSIASDEDKHLTPTLRQDRHRHKQSH